MKRKVICLALIMTTMVFSAVPVFAETLEVQKVEAVKARPKMSDEMIQRYCFDQALYALRYVLIQQIGIGLDITNREAEVYVECMTYENAEISITARLQQYKGGSWKTIATYTNSENSKWCYVLKNRYLVAGYDYRVETTVTVDDGTDTETVTKTGKTVYCD